MSAPRPSPPLLPRCAGNAAAPVPQGGVLVLSSGDDWVEDPGAVVIMRNSAFESNTAGLDNAGVANVGEFASITVAGDGNLFKGNTCGEDGGVFASTTDTLVTVEGGTFEGNACEGVSRESSSHAVRGAAASKNFLADSHPKHELID